MKPKTIRIHDSDDRGIRKMKEFFHESVPVDGDVIELDGIEFVVSERRELDEKNQDGDGVVSVRLTTKKG